MTNVNYAIAELTVALETAENNAPIWEAEGNHEQAATARAHAESFKAAIAQLRGVAG